MSTNSKLRVSATGLPPHPATVVQAKSPHGAKVAPQRESWPRAAARPWTIQRAEVVENVSVIYFEGGEIQEDAERFAQSRGAVAVPHTPQATYAPGTGGLQVHLFAHGNQDGLYVGNTEHTPENLAQWAYDKCASRFRVSGSLSITFHSCMSGAWNLVPIDGSKAKSTQSDKSTGEIFIFKFGKELCGHIKQSTKKGIVIQVTVTGYVSRTFTDTRGCTRVLKYWGKKAVSGLKGRTIDQVEGEYKAARNAVKGTSAKQQVDDNWLASHEDSILQCKLTGAGRS